MHDGMGRTIAGLAHLESKSNVRSFLDLYGGSDDQLKVLTLCVREVSIFL